MAVRLARRGRFRESRWLFRRAEFSTGDHRAARFNAPERSIPSAIAAATVRTDVSGNPALAKATPDARIDLVQAAVIALGLAAGPRSKPREVVFQFVGASA